MYSFDVMMIIPPAHIGKKYELNFHLNNCEKNLHVAIVVMQN